MQNKFKENIINIYGEKGRYWLANLSNIVQEIAIKWGLSDLKPFANLSYNYVAFGFRGNQPIVLKLGVDIEALQREAAALKAFNGYGGIEVLLEESDALLLEKATPVNSLKSYFPKRDIESVQIAANLINKLHNAPIKQDFPHIKDWLTALDRDVDLPIDILIKARRLRDELLETSTVDVLLHGDLHHDNIIQKGEDWVSIDPKGVIGDPAFDLAAFITNPIPELACYVDASRIVENRINQFSRLLNIDPKRIRDWCFVKRVLCSIWALEDGLDVEYFNPDQE